MLSLLRRGLAPVLCLFLLCLGLSSSAFADEGGAAVEICFLCDDARFLDCLTVYDAEGADCKPEAAGVYRLIPGDYRWRFYDPAGEYAPQEQSFTVEGGYTAQFLTLRPAPAVTGESFSFTYVNPLYADVVSPEDIPKSDISPEDSLAGLLALAEARQSGRFLRDSGVSYTDVASAAADLRQQIKDYEETARIRLYVSGDTDAAQWKALCANIFATAIAHTGVPTEGDYLRYEYGGYDATGSKTYYSTSNRTLCEFNFKLKHFTDAAQEAELNTVVNSVLASLNLTGKTDLEKLEIIFSYLCDNIKYGGSGDNDLRYTAYGALVNRLCVCQGYSCAFYRLCLASGIDARIISSKNMNHAWNIAAMDGSYYALDSTWDTGYSSQNYRFFLRGSDYWLDHHLVSGTSEIGDEFKKTAFAAAYSIPAEDYSLTVQYSANGGSGAPGAQSKRPFVPLTLSDTSPKRTGSISTLTVTLDANGGSATPASLLTSRTFSYTFSSWNTKADGSGISYAPGESYNDDGSRTLYARWLGSVHTTAVPLPTPTRPGYSFKGWATSKSASSGITGSYTPSASVTLYALWEASALVPDFILPAGLRNIEEEAFAGGAFRYAVLAENTASIGSRAFANCPNLIRISIPSSTTEIAADAFTGDSGLTVFGKAGSYAETWAKANGVPFEAE